MKRSIKCHTQKFISKIYDSNLGRFINIDRLFKEIGNIPFTNIFAYCTNNPLFQIKGIQMSAKDRVNKAK
jgi:RHS repeat-associated protein